MGAIRDSDEASASIASQVGAAVVTSFRQCLFGDGKAKKKKKQTEGKDLPFVKTAFKAILQKQDSDSESSDGGEAVRLCEAGDQPNKEDGQEGEEREET